MKPLGYYVVFDPKTGDEGYVVACSSAHAKEDAAVQGMTLTGAVMDADHPADYCPQCGYED